MTTILDGRKARDFYKARLIERVSALRSRGVVPCLAIVQIGDVRESNVYIKQKKKLGADIGVEVDHVRIAEDVSREQIVETIQGLDANPLVHGIILQLPIPKSLDPIELINLISPEKDVDGLGDANVGALDSAALGAGAPKLVPATAKGVITLLDFYGIDVKGKNAVVFGRSRLVGHPIAELLKLRGASVSVCHSKTPDPQAISRNADVVVVAIGKPEHIGVDFIRDGAVVVDVGISSRGDDIPGVVGDVDFTAVSPKVSAISPVPGGVGPMTVLSLFDTLVSSVEDRFKS